MELTEMGYGPDGTAPPNHCPESELVRTRSPCPQTKPVWPILLLGCGSHRETHKNDANIDYL